MIDRVLPLVEEHDIRGSLAGLANTLVDDFYGSWQKDPLLGASLSFDMSKGGLIEHLYASPDYNPYNPGIKVKIGYEARPNIGHIEMTGSSPTRQ